MFALAISALEAKDLFFDYHKFWWQSKTIVVILLEAELEAKFNLEIPQVVELHWKMKLECSIIWRLRCIIWRRVLLEVHSSLSCIGR